MSKECYDICFIGQTEAVRVGLGKTVLLAAPGWDYPRLDSLTYKDDRVINSKILTLEDFLKIHPPKPGGEVENEIKARGFAAASKYAAETVAGVKRKIAALELLNVKAATTRTTGADGKWFAIPNWHDIKHSLVVQYECWDRASAEAVRNNSVVAGCAALPLDIDTEKRLCRGTVDDFVRWVSKKRDLTSCALDMLPKFKAAYEKLTPSPALTEAERGCLYAPPSKQVWEKVVQFADLER